ncbi:hypothetical protein ACT7DI_16330 [Bacillus paranthracis]
MLRLVTAKKEEKVFVGIVDEEEEKGIALKRSAKAKGRKGYNPYYNVRMY